MRAIHKPVDHLRLHHELAHKPDLIVLTPSPPSPPRYSSLKAIRPEIANKAWEAKEPAGVKGQGAIAFGGGAVLSKEGMHVLRENDAAQFDEGQLPEEIPAAKPEEDLAGVA